MKSVQSAGAEKCECYANAMQCADKDCRMSGECQRPSALPAAPVATDEKLAELKRWADKAAPVQAWPWRSRLQDAVALLTSARSATLVAPDELDRLREIEHMAWHVLDDSAEHPDGMVHIDGLSDDFRTLVKLLPEDHPSSSDRSSEEKE